MTDVLAGLNVATLTIAAIAGVLAGGYLAAFHPAAHGRELLRRSLLQGWYFASTASILYVGRVAYGLVADGSGSGRLVASWILWLAFCVGIAAGAYVAGRVRLRFGGVYDPADIGDDEEASSWH